MPATAAQPLSSFLAAVHQRAADIERADKAQRTAAVKTATAIHAIPKAVVLVVTVATCECGAVHRNANPNVMVRYDAEGFQNSVHYRRTDLTHFMILPREIKTHEVKVPYCEECF